MRLQCLTSWLTGIGLEPEVLTNLHMVIVNATFAVLEPVLESAVLDRYWIDCEGGDCSYCHELDESDCAEDAFCAPYLGWPIDEERQCLNQASFATCAGAHQGCATAASLQRDENGQCWWFPNRCVLVHLQSDATCGDEEADPPPDCGS